MYNNLQIKMPLVGGRIECVTCSKDESFMWHLTPKGVQCNDCYDIEHSAKVPVPVVEELEQRTTVPAEKPKGPTTKKGSKSARSYKTRQNPNAVAKQISTKGKGRRSIFKKKEPVKLTETCATYQTSSKVFYKGTIWASGDIVSVRDVDGGIYYAQLREFLTDMYCEKSASITWLVPTLNDTPFKKEGFDPMTFVLGPHDDKPYKLDYFEFVMNCPSDYYRNNTPYPDGKPDPKFSNYVWSRLKLDDSRQKR